MTPGDLDRSQATKADAPPTRQPRGDWYVAGFTPLGEVWRWRPAPNPAVARPRALRERRPPSARVQAFLEARATAPPAATAAQPAPPPYGEGVLEPQGPASTAQAQTTPATPEASHHPRPAEPEAPRARWLWNLLPDLNPWRLHDRLSSAVRAVFPSTGDSTRTEGRGGEAPCLTPSVEVASRDSI